MKDPYQILGVKRDASYQDIRKAYRKLCMEIHPDKDPENTENTEDFIELNKAWEILSDPIKRKLYDDGQSVDDFVVKQSVHNEIHNLFFAIVNQNPEAYRTDIVSHILNDIDDNITQAKKRVPELKSQIKNIKKYRGRIKKKSGDEGDNIFEEIITGKISALQGEIKWWSGLPDSLRTLRLVVEQYECEAEEFYQGANFLTKKA